MGLEKPEPLKDLDGLSMLRYGFHASFPGTHPTP